MEIEEAIKTIEVAIAEVEWDYPMNYAIAFEKAIEALKKQEGKNPKETRLFREAGQKIGYCPICQVGLNSDMAYCDNCGQKLDWNTKEADNDDK